MTLYFALASTIRKGAAPDSVHFGGGQRSCENLASFSVRLVNGYFLIEIFFLGASCIRCGHVRHNTPAFAELGESGPGHYGPASACLDDCEMLAMKMYKAHILHLVRDSVAIFVRHFVTFCFPIAML